MEEIFSKKVEKPEIDRRRIKISHETFQKLRTDPEFGNVRHDPSKKKWCCSCGEGNGQYYLYVTGWDDFVKTLGIQAGSRISLHKEDHFGEGDRPYVFKD
ncbi:hypothetical protein SLA2020_170400 [Shorea laevis]